MGKILNATFGIVIAIVTLLVALLGLHVFYPAPQYDYKTDCYQNYKPTATDDSPENAAYKACLADQQEYQETYDQQRKEHASNYFIIANVLALIIFGVSFFFKNMLSLMIGFVFAGLGVLISAFTIGWDATSDAAKFIIAVVVLGAIIWYAIYLRNVDTDKKSK
jgi:hypothetical protein